MTISQTSVFSISQNGGRRHLGFLKFRNFNGWKGQDDQHASRCQIYERSGKLLLRLYGDISIFQNGGRRHLGFLNLKMLMVERVKRFRLRASPCQIQWRLVKRFVRYGDFSIFSERELTFTFAICYRPSVCRLSVVCL